MRGENYAGHPEYATAKIAVWWDMNDCPIPEGYDARRVRPSIEKAFKKLCYSGHVSITAYGDLTQTPDHVLRGLSFTGVAVAHTLSKPRCSLMFLDMLEWRGHNPPPVTMMLISDQVETVFSWELARLQQETFYNLFVASSLRSEFRSVLYTGAEWVWKELVPDTDKHEEDIVYSNLFAMFYCKSCNFENRFVHNFREHLSSREHVLEETTKRKNPELAPVTRKSEMINSAKPEYATAKIAVWWDMYDCPIPEGYDARRVCPSIEGAFKKLGYSGPVSITAYGDHTKTPPHLLQGLSSTGVTVAHTNLDVNYGRMHSDILNWRWLNPPPATMMIISDQVEDFFSELLVVQQQHTKYNLFLAYSFRPYKMSILVTSAEWLWDSLLSVSQTTRPLLQLSTVSETTSPLLQLSTVSQTTKSLLQKCSEIGESTGMFYCRLCQDDIDYKSLDNLRKHLSSEEHALEEAYIYKTFRRSQYEMARQNAYIRKGKRMRKAFRPGFRLLHNHLRRKSQTHDKVW